MSEYDDESAATSREGLLLLDASSTTSKLILTSINNEAADQLDCHESEPSVDQPQLSTQAGMTQQSSSSQVMTSDDGIRDEEELQSGEPDQKPYIGSIEEIAPEHIWNKYILTGYRLNFTTWDSILKSLFQWHNETMNIWTHLVGFVVFLVILLVLAFSQFGEDVQPTVQPTVVQSMSKFMTETDPSSSTSAWDFGFVESQTNDFKVFVSTLESSYYAREISDGSYTQRFHTGFKNSEKVSKWPIVAYLSTALFCLGCSTICHWFADKNHKLCSTVTTLDYWGITILILGTGYPFISYRYACGYLVVYRYIFVVISTILSIICMIVTLNPAFLKPTPKAILFTSFGFFCLIPTLVLYIIDDPEYGMDPGVAPLSWSILSYVIGMTFFLSRFPERFSKTGRFDILFNSHQIHHLCVLAGVTVSLIESFEIYEKRLAFVCPDGQSGAT